MPQRVTPTLQNFEILYICIFAVDIELDSVHGDIHVDTVVNLAQCRAGNLLAACLVVSHHTTKAGEG